MHNTTSQVVLSCTQDDFFAKNRNANFGDLGVAVKGMLLRGRRVESMCVSSS